MNVSKSKLLSIFLLTTLMAISAFAALAPAVQAQETYSVTITAIDTYYWNEQNPVIYVDGYFVGYAPMTLSLSEGDHYIVFDQYCGPFYLPWYNPQLSDGTNWYWNGDAITVSGDMTITAYYDLGA